MARKWVGLLVALLALGALAPATASAQGETAKVLIYSGTTGYRHANCDRGDPARGGGADPVQAAGGGHHERLPHVQRARHRHRHAPGLPQRRRSATPPSSRPRTSRSTTRSSSGRRLRSTAATRPARSCSRPPSRRRSRSSPARAAASARCTRRSTMGAGAVTWPWWDAPGDSAIGALMPGHSATDANNLATVEVSDRHHPSTKDLPDSYRFGDEHYTFSSNVRGTHHVLMTLDEESYNVGTGVTRMGADHPIAWCRMYEGARIWSSSLGHFSAAYLENGGDNNLIKHLVGGVRYVAGIAGKDSDCGATVWTNFSRTVLAHRPARRDRHGHRARRQGLLDRDRQPGAAVRGPAADVRPGDQGDEHAADAADARGSRVLQRRRARHGAGPGLRHQPAPVHLLLAARGPGLQQLPGRRPQRHQPLHVERRGHGRGAGLRAGDPAGAQGQGRQRQPRRRRGPEHVQRPRRRRQPELRLRAATSTSARATTSTRSAPAATATRRSTSATPSATTRATRRPTRTTCAARSCASSRWRTRRAPRAWARRTRSRRATCSRPGRRRRSPRSSPWASATRSRSRPTRRTRARSSSATTARTPRPTAPRAARRASSSGTA